MQIIENIPKLKPRAIDAHKGDFGKVCIVGGSIGMSGAAAIVGRAVGTAWASKKIVRRDAGSRPGDTMKKASAMSPRPIAALPPSRRALPTAWA